MSQPKTSPLVTLKNLHLAFGGPELFQGADLQIERGERICLVGRNGTGKSTLLKLINGEVPPDSGVFSVSPAVRTALLPQEVPLDLTGSVYERVTSGQVRHAELLKEYHRLSLALREPYDEAGLKRLGRIQQALEAENAWHLHQQVQTVISRMGLDESADCGTLSAGLKRRVYLARTLVSDPELLLLDEPTNHMDIDAIVWMEEFLLRSGKTMLFVTHDRAFLDHLATRIVEVDRGVLTSFAPPYENYMASKQQMLDIEAAQDAGLDKHLQREEAWLRRGVKARRTRNEGRVRALMEMRAEVERRRSRTGSVRLGHLEAERSGRLVIEARDVSFAYGGVPLIQGFSTTILRGDKVGVIGPNGCGKTTLLRILLGEFSPDKGTVRHGTGLEVAYFDQLRAQLDYTRTLQQNVAGDGDKVMLGGKPRHVLGYLRDFLFTPEQARAPISRFSGGERNRLLLAKLFTRPANLLVLDEPTNDLDVETLELLEDMLMDFSGTVLMVSHDRAFLNHVATSTLVFEGESRVSDYAGGYDDWQRQRKPSEVSSPAPPKPKKSRVRPAPAGPRKLTFKERRELEQLPDLIEQLEGEIRGFYDAMADPDLYRKAGAEVARLQSSLQAAERNLKTALQRWEELEEVLLQSGE